MVKSFWTKVAKLFFVIVIPTMVAFLSFLIYCSKKFESSISHLGILGAALVIIICLVGVISYEINKTLKKVQLQPHPEYPNLFQEELTKIVNCMFRAIAASIKFPGNSPKIVIHYFYHLKIGEEEFLIKDRRYSVEEEPRSVDFSMEKCRLNSKNVVMCEAFLSNRVIFKNLPHNHKETYDTDIKDYIDSDIHWVLACPVWKGNSTINKLGVVVVFGTSHIVDDTERDKIRALENIGLLLSTSISCAIENTANLD